MNPILRAPLNVEWEITKECNLRCKHCYTSAGVREPEELTTDGVLSVIDQLDKIGVSDITISGGEPLLRKDLEVITSELTRREIPFIVYTNGILLSRERQQSLKEAGARIFSLSLNGTTRETHNYVQGDTTFDTVLKRIAELKDNDLHVQALYTLMKVNLKEASELPSLMDKVGLNSLCIYPFYPTGRGFYHATEFEIEGEALFNVIEDLTKDERIFLGGCLKGIFHGSLVKGSPCARLMCLVSSEGKFRPCNFLPFQTEESLLHKDVYTLWKSPVLEKVRKWQDITERKCRECQYVKTCRGDCLAFHMPLLSDNEMKILST